MRAKHFLQAKPSLEARAKPVDGAVGQISSYRLTIAKSHTIAAATILVLALVYWLWFGLTQVSIESDGGLSIIAAQSILEHGYQHLPSGYIYHRGYIPHYMLAGTIGILGLNDLSIILPSLLMGLGTLWIVYLIGRDIIGRPWIGVLAVALLLGLQIETFYAINPRMYMGLQFFTVLAVYSAWHGYVRDVRGFRLVTFLALVAAILSHEEGIIMVPAISAAVLVTLWIMERRLPKVNWLWFSGAILIVGLAAFFMVMFSFADAVPPITPHGGIDLGNSGELNLDPGQIAIRVFQLERALPLGLVFFPPVLFLVLKFIFMGRGKYSGSTYVLTIFALAVIAVAVGTARTGERYWFYLLPFYSLLIVSAIVELWESLDLLKQNREERDFVSRASILGVFVIGIIANFALVSLATETQYQLARAGYGLPCQNADCNHSISERYTSLKQQIGQDDIIISTTPWVTRYYLGKVDGYMREQRDVNGEFSPFEVSTDEYLGIPLIDTKAELNKLLKEKRRVWIVADSKLRWASSPETQDFLNNNYTLHYKGDLMRIYINCAKAMCKTS